MLHWDDLKFVLALEQQGNLVKAAAQLKTNPTTVSRHIKRISEDYQRTLFTRKNNGEWVLTDDGLSFVTVAKHCESAIQQLDTGGRQIEKQEITVSTTEFLAETIFAPRIQYLETDAKDVALTLDTCDRNVSLAFGEADLAIRMGRPKTGRLVVSKITDLPMGIYSNSGNSMKSWIGLPAELDWVPEMRMGLEHFGCPPTIRVGTYHSIRRMAVENGMGCVGPEMLFDGWRGLKRVNPSAGTKREIWSVVHESRRDDTVLNQVRAWAKESFSAVSSRKVA